MTLYLLDTNIVSDLIRNPTGKVAVQIALVGESNLRISIISAAELRYGAIKSGSIRLLSRVEAILGIIPVVPFDMPSDTQYGKIRADLEVAGRPIGPNDLLIASHACVLGATMVTANVGEFSRVRGLNVENWTA